MPTRYLPLLSLAVLAACGPDPETTLDTVRLTEKAMADAVSAADLDGIMRTYEDDAVRVVSGSEPQVGKAAIRASFEQMLADPGFEMELAPGSAWAARSGELAITTATIRFTTVPEGGTPHTVTMDKQTVWRRDNGVGWKIASDYTVALPESESTPAAPASDS